MNWQTRREFLKSVGGFSVSAGVLGLLGCQKEPKPVVRKDERPNILFIMTDDHASHALSCYGSRINKTPNLDRIAKEGMRFDNCFCTNSICAPSRAVILTGKYSHINGVIDNKAAFDGSQETFPKLLQRGGYETAIIGKWHLKSEPTGFDHYDILIGSWGQGEYFDPLFSGNGQEEETSGYVTDIITDKCLDWFKKRSTDKPFCLLCHHKAPTETGSRTKSTPRCMRM